jgi:signal transduction histidine kinase
VADRRGIRGRIVLLVALGALAPLAALGVVAGARLEAVQEQARQEQERLARVMAAQVGAALQQELAALGGIGSDARFAVAAAGAHDRSLLAALLSRSALLRAAFVARGGEVMLEPPGPLPPCAAARPLGAPRLEADAHDVCLLVPAEGAGTRAVIGGVIAADDLRWTALLQPAGSGVAAALARAGGGPDRAAAAAPLPLPGWQLTVAGPPAARTGPVRLGQAGTAAFLLVVPLVVVFAWGAARSVTRPLAMLGDAAGRIAVGHLEEPLPDLGSDEIGSLGRSLEAMRKALAHALETVARANARLEQRVEERTRELERLNSELRQRERARAHLLRKVISAQEEERKRIARELHDESCQTLSVLAMRLDELQAQVPDAPAAAGALAAARALALRTLDEVHRLIFDLRPSLLDDLGLAAALRWLAARHLDPAGVAVRLEIAPVAGRLAPESETAVFRAVQEALTNVARHAHASSVLVQMGEDKGELVIEVEDDGRGFDPASVEELAPSGRGLGLLGLRERMELLGGSARIESAPGEGTRVVLRAPLPGSLTCLASAS